MMFEKDLILDIIKSAALNDFDGCFFKHLNREILLVAMSRYGRNQRAVSRIFKIPKSTLNDRLKSMGLLSKNSEA